MAVLSRADLLNEINTNITTQTAPDTITPGVLGGVMADMVDSAINQIDQLVNGTSLTTLINNAVSAALTGTIMNGLPGQFSVSLAEEQIIALTNYNTRNLIVLLNENEKGAFDNGGNFNGGVYVVPSTNFTGKFQITDIEAEILDVPASINDSWDIEINQYDSTGAYVSTLASTTFAVTTGNIVGDKLYIRAATTNTVTLTAGTRVRVDIKRTVAATSSVINLKSLIFNNIAL